MVLSYQFSNFFDRFIRTTRRCPLPSSSSSDSLPSLRGLKFLKFRFFILNFLTAQKALFEEEEGEFYVLGMTE